MFHIFPFLIQEEARKGGGGTLICFEIELDAIIGVIQQTNVDDYEIIHPHTHT